MRWNSCVLASSVGIVHRVLVSYLCGWASWVIRWKSSSSWSCCNWMLYIIIILICSVCSIHLSDGRFIHWCIPSSWNPNKHIIMPVFCAWTCIVCTCWLLITGHQQANLQMQINCYNHYKVTIVLISSNIMGGKHVKSSSNNSKTWVITKTKHHKNGKNYPKTERIQCKTKRIVWLAAREPFVFIFFFFSRLRALGLRRSGISVLNHCLGCLSSSPSGWNVVIRRWCCE